MPWTVAVSVAGGALGTLLGVVVGGMITRRSQSRHWLTDTKAAAYRTLLREYARVEFDVRRAYLGTFPVTDVDWARWGAAATEVSLVADEEVVVAAQGVSDALVRLDRQVHSGVRDDERWRELLGALAAAQMTFVNAARRSVNPDQPELGVRVGGPLIPAAEQTGEGGVR